MMIRAGILILTLFATSAVATVPPPVAPANRALLTWTPGTAYCGGQSVTPVATIAPLPGLGWTFTQPAPHPITYRFRIDANGRPLSIVVAGSIYWAGSGDIAPSLAATRFAVGAAQSDCMISYSLHATALADSAPAELAAYSVAATDGALPLEGWQRIAPAARDCLATPRPSPLLRAFPDFDRIAARPAQRDWAMIGYDLDAHGRPVRTHVAFGSGNAALDAASVKAVRASRFTAGARTGCTYPFWRNAAPLPAPAAPAVTTLRPADAQCPQDDGWAKPPALIYPQPFRRRAIEGWAVIGFDVAPWGEIGNVHVLASEPAAAFGEQAEQMLRNARKPASPLGRSGCVEMVRFLMLNHAGGDEPVTE